MLNLLFGEPMWVIQCLLLWQPADRGVVGFVTEVFFTNVEIFSFASVSGLIKMQVHGNQYFWNKIFKFGAQKLSSKSHVFHYSALLLKNAGYPAESVWGTAGGGLYL